MGPHSSASTNNVTPPVNGTDDREARPKFWVAACTRSRSEKKACAAISKLGLEYYLPTQTHIRQWSDRKKKVEVAVIPMTIFVNLTESDILTVKRLPLIFRLLSMPGSDKVARIPSDDIDKLKFILGQSESPVDFDTSAFHINTNVRVVRGPLMGLEGQVISSDNESSEIIVRIGILGGARMSIGKIDLELIQR